MSDETPGKAVAEEMMGCVCTALRRTSREVTRFFDEALRRHRLRVTQLPILVAANLADPAKSVPLAALAERFGMERTTLLRNVRPLVRRKLVTIVAEGPSRRSAIRATAAGRALLMRLYPEWKRAQEATLERVAGLEWSRALDAVEALGEAARRAASD
jgi:DNA-binding MarR family transcriptional regulator